MNLVAERRQVAHRIMKSSLWVLLLLPLAALCVVLLFSPPSQMDPSQRALRIGLATLVPVVAATGLLLSMRGHLGAAAGLVVAVLYLVPMISAIWIGLGIHTIGIALWPVLVLLVGFGWERRAAIALAVLCVLSIAAVTAAQLGGLLPGPTLASLGGPIMFASVFTLAVVLVCWMTTSFSRMFLSALEAAAHSREEVLARERQWQSIVDAEPECVKILEPDGRVRMMNRAGLGMFEADAAEQLEGRAVSGLIAPWDRERFAAMLERVNGGSPEVLEFDIVGLKGGRRRLETHAVPLIEEHGAISGTLAVTRDITERQRGEQALRESEQRMQLALEGADLGLWDHDYRTGSFVHNARFASMLGFGMGEFEATDAWLRARVHPEDA